MSTDSRTWLASSNPNDPTLTFVRYDLDAPRRPATTVRAARDADDVRALKRFHVAQIAAIVASLFAMAIWRPLPTIPKAARSVSAQPSAFRTPVLPPRSRSAPMTRVGWDPTRPVARAVPLPPNGATPNVRRAY